MITLSEERKRADELMMNYGIKSLQITKILIVMAIYHERNIVSNDHIIQ